MMAAFVLGALFVAAAIAAAVIAPDKVNPGFTDAAAVLAFVSLAALSIERGIETVYTVLAGPFGEWWPLSIVKKEFDTYEAEADKIFDPILKQTKEALATAKAQTGLTAERIKEIEATINGLDEEQSRLAAQFLDAKTKLAPGSARLQRVSVVTAQMSSTLSEATNVAKDTGAEVRGLLKAATDEADQALLVISAFQDNPARRLASLSMGSTMGMIIAGATGLNLFSAALEGDNPTALAGKAGIVLTGVVIGLGASPTHEIVKALQSYKEGRRQNPDVARPADPVSEEMAAERSMTNGGRRMAAADARSTVVIGEAVGVRGSGVLTVRKTG
jgi:hypothetical protein